MRVCVCALVFVCVHVQTCETFLMREGVRVSAYGRIRARACAGV